MNIWMIVDSFRDRRIAITREERLVTWGDTVQWGFGWFVKMVGLFLGFWVLALPAAGTRPDNALEQWAIDHRRVIFSGSLLVMLWGMDVRDVVLIFLKRRLQRIARETLRSQEGGPS